MGIEEEEWTELTRTVDVVIHNGALVHWVYVPKNHVWGGTG